MGKRSKYAYDLFVSYTEADRAWVEGYLIDALTGAGVRCHSEAAFALGVPRLLEFERAVQQSQRTLLVLSPASLAEGFGQFTDLLAQSYGLETVTWPVIPLILQPVELPPRLAMLTALDATDPTRWPKVVERLCAELQRPAPRPRPRPPCPYPGMVPFSEADSDRFFGRDKEVQELLECLRLHPFLTVIGPSGSGKSSLIFAGLIPALRQSGLFDSGGWVVRTLRPGETPLAALAVALGGDTADPARTVSELPAAQPDAHRLLLIVDQFEELFTLARSDVERFQQALLRLAETSNCYLILTVRADFYPDLMATPLWREIQAHRLEVLPLDQEGLRQAIVRPAEDVGVFVEGDLVEHLVANAAGEPGVLPLVQETLVLLWERLERRYLPLRAYEELGVAGRTGLQVAMARRADAALAELLPEQQAIARRIFLRLVQFGEGRADTRRQQPVSALRADDSDPQRFVATVQHLAASRLLTLGGGENEADRRVDMAHEALIEGWPTLRGWIESHRTAEMTRRRLQVRAQEWVRLGQRGGLLDQAELAEADEWVTATSPLVLGSDPLLSEFLTASRGALRAQKRTRWARPVLAVVLVAVVALAGWGGYRVWLRQQALRASPWEQFDGGEFLIGTNDPNIHDYSRPEWRAKWPTFALEQHEVSNALYCLCNRSGACDDHAYGDRSVCDPEIASEPVTNLSLPAANRYCQWLGRRLPTEIEWERAARGAQNRPYPTGLHLPTAGEVNISDATKVSSGVWPVTDARQDSTPEGIIGMVGNVSEWTISPWIRYDHDKYLTIWWPDPLEVADGFVVVRGSSWQDGVGFARVSVRQRRVPDEGADDVGFRCVVEPSLETLRKEVLKLPRNE